MLICTAKTPVFKKNRKNENKEVNSTPDVHLHILGHMTCSTLYSACDAHHCLFRVNMFKFWWNKNWSNISKHGRTKNCWLLHLHSHTVDTDPIINSILSFDKILIENFSIITTNGARFFTTGRTNLPVHIPKSNRKSKNNEFKLNARCVSPYFGAQNRVFHLTQNGYESLNNARRHDVELLPRIRHNCCRESMVELRIPKFDLWRTYLVQLYQSAL